MKKNVILIIIVTVIAVILIGIFAILYNNQPGINSNSENSNSPPFDFTISSSNSSCILKQGKTTQITISIIKTNGTAQTVNLTSDASQKGILCNFAPSSGKGNFSSIVTIEAPNFLASESYKINFSATSNTMNHSLPYNVDVLSSKVRVSGAVVFSGYRSPATVELYSMTFVDSQTNETIKADVNNPPYWEVGIPSYEATLGNWHRYEVNIVWRYYVLGPMAFGHQPQKVGSYNSSIYVNAGVGKDTIIRDFSVPVSYP